MQKKVGEDLASAYREMAADERREAEAREWTEAMMGDVADESELLLAINRGLPPEVAEQYRTLINRHRAGTLSPEEHQELLRLTDEAERLQAERIESLAELARIRNQPLGSLMEELGIRPTPNA